jgi:hypothetical protein
VGRVAGVTVRALHHYDSLGPLSPSERTSGGHRLYSASDVERRLSRLLGALDGGDESTQWFLDALEAMSMFEKYYTPEQLEQLEQRRQALGDEAIKAVEQEWRDLYAQVRAHRQQGTDPADPEVQKLVRRSGELIRMFTGGDPGIAAGLKRMYEQEGPARASRGVADPADIEYLERARAASRS